MKQSQSSRRRLLISCPIFEREIDDCLSKTAHPVDVAYLPLGLHGDAAQDALVAIQKTIDEVDAEMYDTVLIGYGVCNFGIRGIVARELPLIIPRAHDCISLLFGDRQRYQQFFETQPDTYFFTSGWIDAAETAAAGGLSISPSSVRSQFGIDYDLPTLIEKYGEDNAKYIYEQLKPRDYGQHVYVSTGCEDEPALIEKARHNAQQKGCPLQVVAGDAGLIDALLGGPWDEEHFLITPPGKQVAVTYDDRLIDWTQCDGES